MRNKPGGEHGKAVKRRAEEVSEVRAVERQENIGPRESGEQDRAVFGLGEEVRAVEREDVFDDPQVRADGLPISRAGLGQVRKVVRDLLKDVRRTDRSPTFGRGEPQHLPRAAVRRPACGEDHAGVEEELHGCSRVAALNDFRSASSSATHAST